MDSSESLGISLNTSILSAESHFKSDNPNPYTTEIKKKICKISKIL